MISASWVFFHLQHKYYYMLFRLLSILSFSAQVFLCFSASWVFFHSQHKYSCILFRLFCILSSSTQVFLYAFRLLSTLSSSTQVFLCFSDSWIFFHPQHKYSYMLFRLFFHPLHKYSNTILPLEHSFILGTSILMLFCLLGILSSSTQVFLCFSASWVFFHPQHKYSYMLFRLFFHPLHKYSNTIPPLEHSFILGTSILMLFCLLGILSSSTQVLLSASSMLFHPPHRYSSAFLLLEFFIFPAFWIFFLPRHTSIPIFSASWLFFHTRHNCSYDPWCDV